MIRNTISAAVLVVIGSACGDPRVLARRESPSERAPEAALEPREERGHQVEERDDIIDDDPLPADDSPGGDEPADPPAPPPDPPPPDPPVDDPPVDDEACTESDLPTPNNGVVEPEGLDGCPAGMASIDGAACMDRWEAHLVELVNGEAAPFSPFSPSAGRVVVARSAPGAVPQGYVSGLEAASACARAGKRLCTDAEWTRACRGESERVYPYGDTREPGVCNDARAVHPVIEYFGTGAAWIWSELGHPCINQQHDTVDLTGTNPGCVDESGRFFDLMGNLHEWIDDPAGTFRGGFYVDTSLNGPGCLYRTTAHNTAHWDYSTGFRCCADR